METVSHTPSIAQPYSRQSGPAPPQNYPHASRYNQPPTQPATFQRYSSVGSRHSDHLRYTGHYPGDYRDPSSSNHSERQRGCWNCGSLDHYRRECPNPPRNESRAPVTNPPLPTSFRVEHTTGLVTDAAIRPNLGHFLSRLDLIKKKRESFPLACLFSFQRRCVAKWCGRY